MGSIEGKKSLDIDRQTRFSASFHRTWVASWLVRRRPGREVSGLSPWLRENNFTFFLFMFWVFFFHVFSFGVGGTCLSLKQKFKLHSFTSLPLHGRS